MLKFEMKILWGLMNRRDNISIRKMED